MPDKTWSDAFHTVDGWTGGDGCATVPLDARRVLWIFSDSTIGQVADGKHAPGTTIVNNAVAVSSHDTGDVPRFFWRAGGKPGAIFVPESTDRWYWTAGGGAKASHSGPLVLFLWSMGRSGRADPGVWDFQFHGTDAAIVSNPGDDPSAWVANIVPVLPEDGGKHGYTREWGSAVVTTKDASYIFGVDTTDTARKQLLVARCDAERIAESGAWSFWDGAAWSPGADRAAAIAADAVDEFSVMELDDGRFAMVQIEPNLGRRIGVRTATGPTGPWTDPRFVYECPEPAADQRLMVYSAKGHAEVSDSRGLLVSYCVNSTDFWHMLGDATIYRPRFVRVPWEIVNGAKP